MNHDKEIKAAITALDDWMNIFAETECNPERVQEAKDRILANHGTIGYITKVRGDLERALEQETPNNDTLGKFTSGNNIPVERATITKTELKAMCCNFFQWWWNQPGNNTEMGFDEWYSNGTTDNDVKGNDNIIIEFEPEMHVRS